MPYMRRPYIYRKYTQHTSAPSSAPREEKASDTGNKAAPEKLVSIPLPNEEEDVVERTHDLRSARKKLLPDFFKFSGPMHLEEIILLGLVFILLKEGIEDELLVILLIYILLG